MMAVTPFINYLSTLRKSQRIKNTKGKEDNSPPCPLKKNEYK